MSMNLRIRDVEMFAMKAGTILAIGCIIYGILSSAFGKTAHSEECFSSDAKVRVAFGEKTWSAYTHHMDGHRGELCYYASVKGKPRVHLHPGYRESARDRLQEHLVATAREPLKAIAIDEAPKPRMIHIRHDPMDNLALTTVRLSLAFFERILHEKRPFWDSEPDTEGWRDAAFVMTGRSIDWPLHNANWPLL